MKKRIPIYLLLAAVCSLGSFVAEAVGTATVVRAHPRLTRGLEKESLIGIRFDDNYGGAPSTINLHFDFKNCNRSVIKSIEVWYQKSPAYAFSSDDEKNRLLQTSLDSDDLEISDLMQWIYPKNQNNSDSDYLWIVAAIDPDIPAAAEIRVSITNDEISLAGNKYVVKNGKAKAPHRVFPYYYRSGAYFRQDRVTANSCAPLENETASRVKALDDIILINHLDVTYQNGVVGSNWTDADTSGVEYVKGLRDTYHKKAMVRIGLTKGTVSSEGETYPLSLICANEEARQELIRQIIDLMERLGVDGLDIDWEYPGVKSVRNEKGNLVAGFDSNEAWERDWHNYGLLMRDLSEKFFDRGWVLSMCTNLGWSMPSDATMSANRTKFMNVLHVPDYIDSMAYGGQPLNASPRVMIDKGIKCITDCGVPKRRIVVGQAMYAYENGNPGWSGVVNWIKKQYGDDKIRWWDADYVLRDGTTKETYEGPSSYQAKCNWCRANDYGGVMSWGYYTDVAWNGDDLMSLARHQAKSCWPIASKTWPTPEQDSEGWYLLKSESDWFWLRDNSKVKAKFAADITLEHDPLPIESWQGTLDGNGHKLIIPRDTWLCYDDNPALIRTLNGTVKNLTVDLYGRVVSRASRWNDTACTTGENTLTTPLNDHCAAVLASRARWGANVDNVTIVVHAGAEVQGPVRTSALIADVFVSQGNKALITNSKAIIEGTVHSLARNTAESDIAVTGKLVGSLIASASVGTGSTVTIDNCAVYSESGLANIGEKANAIAATITSGVDVRDAYLLNGDLDKLAEQKAAFKFTSEDLEKLMEGVKLTTINGVEFNGKLTILGASALDGEWRENLEGAKFFKAVLTLE